MSTLYQKPNSDDLLTALRNKTEAWQANVDRVMSDERTGKGISWEISLLEERDDLAKEIITHFRALDEAMATHHGLADCSPASWRVTPLTEEQLDNAMRDWPELAILGPRRVRELSDHFGIRYVRYIAQELMKNARQILAAEDSPAAQ